MRLQDSGEESFDNEQKVSQLQGSLRFDYLIIILLAKDTESSELNWCQDLSAIFWSELGYFKEL
jgi:hypothetical protein